MCVIFGVDEQRPTVAQIKAAWETNNSGGGVAWREEGEVHWHKGLDLQEMITYCAELPLPYVAHFRIPSVGGSSKQLTHPFPISPDAEIIMEGHTTGEVLFHNGTWMDWRKILIQVAVDGKYRLTGGKWSDSRALAWLVDKLGPGFADVVDEKILIFGPETFDVYGSWYVTTNNIWVSNTLWERKVSSQLPAYYRGGRYEEDDYTGTTPAATETTQPVVTFLVPAAKPQGDEVPLHERPFEELRKLREEGKISKNAYKKALKARDKMIEKMIQQDRKDREKAEKETLH